MNKTSKCLAFNDIGAIGVALHQVSVYSYSLFMSSMTHM